MLRLLMKTCWNILNANRPLTVALVTRQSGMIQSSVFGLDRSCGIMEQGHKAILDQRKVSR